MRKVSIIIPVYNSTSYVEKCARSIFEQSFHDMEIIFVDDGSTDRTAEYLEKILTDYPKRAESTTIIRNSENLGQTRRRFDGLAKATGEYIYFCDSDDWIESHFIDKVYSIAINESSDIVCCDVKYWKEDFVDRVWLQPARSPDELCSGLIDATFTGILCNKLFRHALLESNVNIPMYNMGEDWALCVQYATLAQTVSYAQGCFYNFNMRVGSSSFSDSFGSSKTKYEYFLENFKLIINLLKSKGLEERYHHQLLRRCLSLRFSLLPYIDHEEALSLWNTTLPEYNKEILQSHAISNKEKLLFITVSIGLYGWIRRAKKRIRI